MVEIHHTWGDGMVRDLLGVGEDHKRIGPSDIADRLIHREAITP
jgi:predicted amidohydrolase YtcJ